MQPPAIVARILGRPIVVTLLRVFDVYGRAPGGLLANGLAFTSLFAIAPIALVTLGVAGLIVDDPAVQAQIGDALASVFPPAKDLIESVLQQLTQGAAATSLVGVIGLLWTVSQFYVTLDIAFSRIYSDRPRRDMVVRTARGFAWVAGLVGLVVALIVIASLTTAAEALIPASASAITAVGRVVTSPPFVIIAVIAVVLVIYVVLPPDAPHWRLALVPAAVAGLAIFVLAQLFLFAAPRLVGAAALAGALATAFIALAWLSFTFQALLLGAAWVRVRMDEERARSALSGPAAPAEPGIRGE